jgi:hypothetical protein
MDPDLDPGGPKTLPETKQKFFSLNFPTLSSVKKNMKIL